MTKLRSIPIRRIIAAIVASVIAFSPALLHAASMRLVQNAPYAHDYGQQLLLPPAFGAGEFTVEMWVRLDDSFPVGPTDGGPEQLINWCDADPEPYSTGTWWFDGNFLLDGHHIGAPAEGSFDVQFYGAGRVRWLFGDGSLRGVQAWPADTTPTLLDSRWHLITLVRRWMGGGGAHLELWVDGELVATEDTPRRTDMQQYWSTWDQYPPGLEGWFWGAEKQAAIDIIPQYEDYKGLLDELRLWAIARTPDAIETSWLEPVTGTESGLVAVYRFDEAGGDVACDQLNPTACIHWTNLVPESWSDEQAPPAVDTDGDGVVDALDNCTILANPEQRDTDGDGYGNRCDPDLNGDGIVNFGDLAAFKTVFLTDDPDADFDGDGLVNFGDLAVIKAFFLEPPGPSGIVP